MVTGRNFSRFSKVLSALLLFATTSWMMTPSSADSDSCCPAGCSMDEGAAMSCRPVQAEDDCGHDTGLAFSPSPCSGGAVIARVVTGKMAISPVIRFHTTMVEASLDPVAPPSLWAVPARIPDPPPRG